MRRPPLAPALAVVLVAADVPAQGQSGALGCPALHTETTQRFIGTGGGSTKTSAITAARVNALATLKDTLCVGLSDLSCETAMSKKFVGEPHAVGNAGRYSACFWYDLRTSDLYPLKKLEAELQASLAGVAAQVRDSVGGTDPSLFLTAPLWAGGCDAGDVGRILKGRLNDAVLAGQGVKITQLGLDASFALALELTPDLVGKYHVTPTLIQRASNSGSTLRGFTTPQGLFVEDEQAGASCAGWARMGLAGSGRVAPGAGTASIGLSGGTDLCSGEQYGVSASISGASTPTDLYLWSVEAGGRASVVYRTSDPQLSLSKMVSFTDLADGQEALVAVAVPSGAGDTMAKYPRDCKVDAFSTAMLPPGASWASVTFSVHASGTGRCTSYDPQWEPIRAEAEGILAGAPNCPR